MPGMAPPRLAQPLRLAEHDWPEGTPPLVSILCPTYNHERYLGACLDGFLLQETTFPVEVVVQDDASTDGTAGIVADYARRHPRLFRPVFHEANQYSRGRKPAVLAFPHSRGGYIATCEGDDFWSLPAKLEKQVAVLESESDCFLCGGRVYVVREGHPSPYMIDPPDVPERLAALGPAEMLRGQWAMRTLSRMARRAVWEEYVSIVGEDPVACDFLFSLYCIARSRMDPAAFRCLDEVVGTYREHAGGIWYGADEIAKLKTNLGVFLFALQHFDFGDQARLMESGFINIAEQIGLNESMNPKAYALYHKLKELRTPPQNGIFRKILNLSVYPFRRSNKSQR